MVHSTIRDSSLDVALSILRRRKWIGVIAFAATLSLGVTFAVFLPDIYRGVATVIVENQDASSAFVRGSVPELETRLITIQQELLSRARLSDLIIRLNLYPTWRRRTSMESIVERLRRDIHVELSRTDQGRPTTIGFKISYIGLDAKSAAAVPNALAVSYVEENSRIRERETGQMAEFLKRQLETMRQAVDVQQARLNRFKEQRAGQLPEQVSINMVTVERLNTRLRLNTDDQLKLREREDRLIGATPDGESAPDPLQVLKQHLADLQSKFTDKHPDVIRTKAQISEMERQRASNANQPIRPAPRRGDALGNSEAELASLQREERTLRSEIAAYEERIQAAPKVEQELEALERDYSSAKDSYQTILKRYEEAQLADSLEQTKKAESFRVLDAAVVPTFPAAPNRIRLLILACLFAFASGIGMMLLTEHLDTSFHTVGELRQFTTLPVLASIPYVSARPTFGGVLRVVLSAVAVIGICALLAGFAYRTARENTQLVWMLSAPQL
jgi:polysaccharide chain length determinant protein (PEP-CTERM system associated)